MIIEYFSYRIECLFSFSFCPRFDSHINDVTFGKRLGDRQ